MVAERVSFADAIFRPLGEDAALALYDDTATWRDKRGYTLSQRAWLAREETRRAIDDTLRRAIANGSDPLVVARELERYLHPDYAPKRNAQGRLVPGQPRGIVTAAPRNGHGSYWARRLARTEITRAFGQATLQANALNPFVTGSKWNTSARHRGDDVCDRNAAGHSRGMGRGEYRDGEFPAYPGHPMCRCFVTAVTADPDAVVAQLRRELALDERPGNIVAFPVAADERSAARQGGTGLIARLVRVWKWLRGEEAA